MSMATDSRHSAAGPMHYADAVGLDKVLARVQEFQQRFGADNWTPAPLLERLVADKSTLAEWAGQQVED